MSGHSKWSTIKRQKAVTDARRAAVFTKLAKAITVAAREGGADPDTNFRLRLAVSKAREANMPNDNVDRAIARGSGSDDTATLASIVYEAYGPGGIGMLIDAVTDNKNRTSSDIRAILTKNGGSLASPNSVAWQFHQKGVIRIAASEIQAQQDPENFQLALIDTGAEDVREEEEGWTIIIPKEKLSACLDLVSKKNITPASQGLEYIPQTLQVPQQQEALTALIEQLEEQDDVENVFTNAEH